jgi:hypothetical protein
VSAMGPGLAQIIEKVRISWYFESPETDLHVVENACCINYAYTRSPKRVYWLSKANFGIPVLPILDVKTRSNCSRKVLEWASLLR